MSLNFDKDKISCAKAPMVISFSSGVGGVGKTSSIKNIASLMTKKGKKVLIVNFDARESDIRMLHEQGVYETNSRGKTLKEALLVDSNVYNLLISSRGTEELNFSNEEKMFFWYEMEEIGKRYDLILINNPVGLSDQSLYFCLASQQRIIIISPKPSSISTAYGIIKLLAKKHHVKSFSIIVNLVKDSREAQKIFRQLTLIADRYIGLLSINYLGFIPKDSSLLEAISLEKKMTDSLPEATTAKTFDEITNNILIKIEEDYVDGNIKFFNEQLIKT